MPALLPQQTISGASTTLSTPTPTADQEAATVISAAADLLARKAAAAPLRGPGHLRVVSVDGVDFVLEVPACGEVRLVSRSGVRYVLRPVTDDAIAAGAGLVEPVSMETGSVLGHWLTGEPLRFTILGDVLEPCRPGRA